MPVINKNRPPFRPSRDFVKEEIENVIGIPAMDAPLISAKQGIGTEEVLERIVSDVPAPSGDENAPLQALIFDLYYDAYKGVIIYCRVFNGTVKPGDKIRLMATEKNLTWSRQDF